MLISLKVCHLQYRLIKNQLIAIRVQLLERLPKFMIIYVYSLPEPEDRIAQIVAKK